MIFITQYNNPINRDHGKMYLSNKSGLYYRGGSIQGEQFDYHGMQSFIKDSPRYLFRLWIEL